MHCHGTLFLHTRIYVLPLRNASPIIQLIPKKFTLLAFRIVQLIFLANTFYATLFQFAKIFVKHKLHKTM